jgi:hypothetical protein
MARYLLEVIFEQIESSTNEEGGLVLTSNIRSQVWSFENEDANVALNDARTELHRVTIEGLKLHGGAVIETIILPSSIKQIGLIDFDQYEADNSTVESIGAPVPTDVEVSPETTSVDFNVAG